MGWAKYFEDNVSIGTNRMNLRDDNSVGCCTNKNYRKTPVYNVRIISKNENLVNREAPKHLSEKVDILLISFTGNPHIEIIDTLRNKGWRWDKKKRVLSNDDTKENRQLARDVVRKCRALLSYIAA